MVDDPAPDAPAAPTAVRRLRAAAHPLRLRMLSLLTGAELSAAEVARALGTTHANASYHLRVLLEAGEVVVAGEEVVRGGVAKRYRHPWRERADLEQAGPPADPAELRGYVRAMAEELVRRYDARAPHTSGTVTAETDRGTLTDAEVWVEPATWSRALDLLREAGALLHDGARPPGTPGTRHVALTLGAFAMAAPTDEDRG